ncbi:MAG: hypothetical protein Q6351_003145 [Candidatus Njordarchaeum guaymaensis]
MGSEETKCQFEEECRIESCKFIKNKNIKSCGLYTFLSVIEDERKLYPKEQALIQDLRTEYIKVWNSHADSRAKGVVTGYAFENWIRKNIKQKCGKGEVKFRFGSFRVDVAIPSTDSARVILEIKLVPDLQHILALGGLLNFSLKKRKVGFVTFYEPKQRERNVLNSFKRKYKGRFDYFVIRGGWSNTIKKLNKFCST